MTVKEHKANTPEAHPPATLEGWYALHQIFRLKPDGNIPAETRKAELLETFESARELASRHSGAGWSAAVRLIGSLDHLMLVHFRESLESLLEVQTDVDSLKTVVAMNQTYSFLSVTEAGLYHISAELARGAEERGGKVGDEDYSRALKERSHTESESDHVKRRLFPPLPPEMPYVCFYPMSKRRTAGQNWYTLSLDERSRLMQSHGSTGRRYAGKVQQIITGAIGFDSWEWGVTLFAAEPLDFKRLVTDMRFDEVSAKYADFGEFYVGRVITE